MITLTFSVLSLICSFTAIYYRNKNNNLLVFVCILASFDFIKWTFWSRLPLAEMQQKVSLACVSTLMLVAVFLIVAYLKEKRFFA